MQQVVLKAAGIQKLSIKQGFLYKGTGLVLPKKFSKIPTILVEFTASLQWGHSGFFRTYKRITGVYYWAGMKQDIKDYIMQCQQRQQSKIETLAPVGLLQSLPITTKVWTEIFMDFIGGLPRVGKHDTTKYAHLLLLGHPYRASEDVGRFIAGIIRLHGFPEDF